VDLEEQNPTTLILSAGSPSELARATEDLSAWVTEVCKRGHAPCPQRRAIHVESWTDAEAALRDQNRFATGTAIEGGSKLVMSLPGQGTVRPGILHRLFAAVPGWARHLDRLANLAREVSGFDYLAWLGDPHADADLVLKDNAKSQLTIFCVGLALARWLIDLGLAPDGYVGHSLGEWIGATLARVVTEEDAILAIHHRGRLMQATGPGAALIVRASADALSPLLPSDVALACVNAPNLCLVSGRPDAIARCAEQLSAGRIVTRPAPIYVAVHSPVMDAVVEPFFRRLAEIDFRSPQTPLLSSATGTWMPPELAANAAYWAQQLRAMVRFDAAAETLLEEPRLVVLEVGVGSALTSLLGIRIKDKANQRVFALFGRDEPPPAGYSASRPFHTLGELWVAGVALDVVGRVELTRPAPQLPLPGEA
jgi:acyl transferase domain-containing protein